MKTPIGRVTGTGVALPLKPWKSDRMAEKWLADAQSEAKRGQKLADTLKAAAKEDETAIWHALAGSVRREIVLAACFAEAFLFEYVRDYVIGAPGDSNFDLFRDFMFEPLAGEKRPLKDEFRFGKRWRKTIRALHAAEKMRDPNPYLMGSTWKHLLQLMAYRNNLVHANVGLPREAWDNHQMYEPSPATLVKLGPCWATQIVIANAQELHALNVADRDPPDYLKDS